MNEKKASNPQTRVLNYLANVIAILRFVSLFSSISFSTSPFATDSTTAVFRKTQAFRLKFLLIRLWRFRSKHFVISWIIPPAAGFRRTTGSCSHRLFLPRPSNLWWRPTRGDQHHQPSISPPCCLGHRNGSQTDLQNLWRILSQCTHVNIRLVQAAMHRTYLRSPSLSYQW